MTRYTILTGAGEAIATGLSLHDAARELLTEDGREYEVRTDKRGGFSLWTRHRAAERAWSETCWYSFSESRPDAEAEIFAAVVGGERPAGRYEAITDAQYAEMLAQTKMNKQSLHRR